MRKRKPQPLRTPPAPSPNIAASNNNSTSFNANVKPDNGQTSACRNAECRGGTAANALSLKKRHLSAETAKVASKFNSKASSKDGLFPWWTPLAVWAVVFVTRTLYVSDTRNWWVLHPDEVFQSVEVAFSEVHGYGFRAYEYLPPPGSDVKSPARQQEGDLGMHSLRSFLFPKVFMVAIVVGEWFGVRPYLMAKMFHCAVSSLLPLATYFFCINSFRCHDIASLASVLVGFSVHLVVFGTHTLINSFLSPIVIFALIPIFRGLLTHPGERTKTSGGETNLNGVSCRGLGMATTEKSSRIFESGTDEEELDENPRNDGEWKMMLTLFISGLVLGVACYIRIDLVVFLMVLIAPHCLHSKSKQVTLTLDLQVLFPTITGFTSGMAIGGADDSWSYGAWFISPHQWLKFNVGFDFATLLFGRQDLGFYLHGLLLHNASLVCLFAAFVLFLILAMISVDFRNYLGTRLTLIFKLFVSSALLLGVYSLKGHKEMRFLHNFIVVIIIVYSSSLVLFIKYLLSRDSSRLLVKGSLYAGIVLYLFNQWRVMPASEDRSNKPWVYNSGWDSNYVNDCFDFISRQSDVTGVFVDRSIHTSAAFSVLRHDVPLIALIHYELYEFGPSAYLPLRPVSWMARKDTVKVRTLSSISDYISIYNSDKYLLKTLLSKKHYNYLVLKKEKNFIQKGYKHVFTSGTMKVLQRTFEKNAEEYLSKYAKSLPVGSNSTILEYESSWLLTFGLYELAEERLLTALQVGKPTPRVFQMLVKAFLDQNKVDNARKAEQLCIDQLGVEACRKPQPRVVLHKDYDIELPVRR